MASPKPDSADLNPELVVRLATEADGFMEFGLLDRAMDRAERLLLSRVGRLAGLSLKAECLRRQARFSEALPLLQEALSLNPGSETLWVNLGWCLKRCNLLAEAIKAMEGLLEQDPENTIGHYNLACYLALKGDKKRCLPLLAGALKLDGSLRQLIATEKDFDSLREDQDFRAVVNPK